MQTLQIDKKNARQLYPTAAPEFKTMLEDSFGRAFFSQKITDRVETFADILDIAGKTMEQLVNENDTPDEIAYKQAKLIAQVYNEGTILKPGDNAYYPWHKIVKDSNHPSGFGLSYLGCVYWAAGSFVGLRLCFKEPALATDAGKKFLTIYENLKIR